LKPTSSSRRAREAHATGLRRERGGHRSLGIPSDRSLFWLIDSLDGTKKFISRNGDFTCNIALVETARPVLGLVRVTADGLVLVGGPDAGDEVVYRDGSVRPI